MELLDDDGKTIMQPNSCHLRRLTLSEENEFELEVVTTMAHPRYVSTLSIMMKIIISYHSNMWMTKFGTNGRYIASPTTDGKIFIWNVRSKELVSVLHDHSMKNPNN